MRKKVCIVTGSRAEYDLFYPLLKELGKEPAFRTQIAVTGMHLSPRYGSTYRQILRDGFTIDEKVKIPLDDNTSAGIIRSVGLGMIGFSAAFKRLGPDFVVLLGDRFETYSAAAAAFIAGIPIAHLYGGELTEGSIDDAIRHSITKMSVLHFTSTEEYRRRVIQLGEEPDRVFNVGALGIDNIRNLKLLSRDELEKELKFGLGGRTMLATFHPATLERGVSGSQIAGVLSALRFFGDLRIVFTRPNSDIDSKIISRLIDKYVQGNPKKSMVVTSLGRLKYLSLLRSVDVVLGNSSSGIIETPSFGKPTVNVGDRQRGRIMAGNIIQCAPGRESVIRALKKAFSPEFRSSCRNVKSPYGNGSAAKKIVSILKRRSPVAGDLKKRFYDLG